MSQAKVDTRTELLQLLAEAAELEHGIACSYLYAAFSLKRDLAEGGMTWPQQQMVRRWASQLYFIASQEMLHLGLVWNLTTAIGGTPYCIRPNFPQDKTYYPIRAPIALEPFGLNSLRRFILYEHPMAALAEADPDVARLLDAPGDDAEDIDFSSIGELYSLIGSAFATLDEKALFVGSPSQQMTPDLVHFPDLIEVTDRASALRAVNEIVHQGEGGRADRVDSHYGAFVAILREFNKAVVEDPMFAPARPAMRNPVAMPERAYGARANPIRNPQAQQAAALFDSAYSLMLRMLAWSFEFDAVGAAPQLAAFCATAIDLMPRVLLPLGEGLMLMPAGQKRGAETAGPGFGLARLLALPPDPTLATLRVRERLLELSALAADLLAHDLPPPVRAAAQHLQEIAEGF
jgi:hypothetical protein